MTGAERQAKYIAKQKKQVEARFFEIENSLKAEISSLKAEIKALKAQKDTEMAWLRGVLDGLFHVRDGKNIVSALQDYYLTKNKCENIQKVAFDFLPYGGNRDYVALFAKKSVFDNKGLPNIALFSEKRR